MNREEIKKIVREVLKEEREKEFEDFFPDPKDIPKDARTEVWDKKEFVKRFPGHVRRKN